jgi:archaeal flagellar protein FlaJ
MEKVSKPNLFFDKDTLIANLKTARINQYYKDFVRNSMRAALIVAFLINAIIFFIIALLNKDVKNNGLYFLILLTLPLGFSLLFKFFLKTPDIAIIRSKKNIGAEIISAIRFLVLDLKANAPLFDALQNLRKNFGEIGNYLSDIIIKVKLGSSLEKALNEAVETVPSEEFRVLLWQLLSHLQTGTNITNSLDIIADEIAEDQRISFKKYGKKLNVLSLLYMIIAIIIPTIGFIIIVTILSFINFPLNAGIFVLFWFGFSVVQLIFLALSSGNRPVVEQ